MLHSRHKKWNNSLFRSLEYTAPVPLQVYFSRPHGQLLDLELWARFRMLSGLPEETLALGVYPPYTNRIPISKVLPPSLVSLGHLQPDVTLIDTSKANLEFHLLTVQFRFMDQKRVQLEINTRNLSPQLEINTRYLSPQSGHHNILVHKEGHSPPVTLSSRSREHTGRPIE